MNSVEKLQALQSDVDVIRARIARQEAQDPDHVLALAMFNADLRRANYRVMEFLAGHPRMDAQLRRAA